MTETNLSAPRRAQVLILLAAGAALWWFLGWRDRDHLLPQLICLVAALVISLIPPARIAVAKLLDSVREPSPRAAFIAGMLIAGLSTVYLIATAGYQQRDFVPKFHDEHMYLLQMQMLARGHLWYSQHELADFFESSHILVKPVYASIYFPGLALMYLPTVWLKLPIWLMPALICGAGVGMLYRLMTQLIDGVAGAISVVLMLGLKTFRSLSVMVMSHPAMMLLGMLVIWSWLRWREKRDRRWLIAMGVIGGWMAITRPVETFAWAVPLGIAMLYDMRGIAWRKKLATFAIGIAAAIPLLSLQLILNVGVTGHLFKTPDQMYLEENSPQHLWGFKKLDPAVRPQTTLREKLDYYEQFTLPALEAHRSKNIFAVWWRERLPIIVSADLPSSLLLLLIPAGVLGLCSLARWVTFAPFIGFIAIYFVFVYLLPHYPILVAPCVIFLALLGREVVGRAFQSSLVAVLSALAMIAVTLPSFPELNSNVRDEAVPMPTMVYSHVALPELVHKPAIVLFTYSPHTNVNEEPVYNESVAWPDDAEVIRAHDLGPKKNWRLIKYYAEKQPQRRLYIFDRGTAKLHDLGNIADLARQMPATAP